MIDERIRALADKQRRQVLLILRDCRPDEGVAVSTLVEQLAGEATTVHQSLTHQHLPILNECDLINWHRSRNLIHRGTAFEEICPLLNTIRTVEPTGSEQYSIQVNRVRDVVARRLAEEDPARSHRFLEKVLERTTDMIAVVDSTKEFIFASKSVEKHLGYTPAELRDHGPFGLIHPDDRAMVADQFEQRLADPDQPTGISYRARHKDGHYVSCQSRAYNLMDDPDIEGVLIYTHTTGTHEDQLLQS